MTTNTTITTDTRYVYETLFTDTRCYEIVARTAKTLTLRPMNRGEATESRNVDGNPYPIVYVEAVPAPDAETSVVRLRKDGTYRINSWSPLRATDNPVFVTDYRY